MTENDLSIQINLIDIKDITESFFQRPDQNSEYLRNNPQDNISPLLACKCKRAWADALAKINITHSAALRCTALN